MSAIIRLDKLTKIYGRGTKQVEAVKDLSFEVQAGQIYGFLGPNGAGKTTTIRMILSLVYPTSGNVQIFDKPLHDAHEILQTQVGALVEQATFYPYMSGWDNLAVLARTGNYFDAKRIDEVLNLVGLSQYANNRTKTYSTGMKQRLGLAAALLNDPDLLILDEPSNGLDPQGIQEMRGMLQNLAKNEGKTIFLSSHLLHEVEQICDRVAIIRKGQLIREGDVSELLAQQSSIQIEAQPQEKALSILNGKYPVTVSGDYLEIAATREQVPEIINQLSAEAISIYQVMPQKRSLEDYFLEVTHD